MAQNGMNLKGRGEALRGRSSETPWVFAQAYFTLIHSPRSQLSERLTLPEEPELARNSAAALWPFLVTTT